MKHKDAITQMLREGIPYKRIAAERHCSLGTVCFHAKSLGIAKGTPRYNWSEVQDYYNAGHSARQCAQHFGFARTTWTKAVKRGQIKRRDHRIPLSELLVDGRRSNTVHIKSRLLNEGLLKPECYECGLREWRGKPIALQLDHINGKGDDNRLENLRLLCPNCHSQTETFCGKNLRNGTKSSKKVG